MGPIVFSQMILYLLYAVSKQARTNKYGSVLKRKRVGISYTAVLPLRAIRGHVWWYIIPVPKLTYLFVLQDAHPSNHLPARLPNHSFGQLVHSRPIMRNEKLANRFAGVPLEDFTAVWHISHTYQPRFRKPCG